MDIDHGSMVIPRPAQADTQLSTKKFQYLKKPRSPRLTAKEKISQAFLRPFVVALHMKRAAKKSQVILTKMSDRKR